MDFIVYPTRTSSRFDPNSDRIEFGRTYHSAWTAAHEYVHALHHESLGGLWSTTNCNPHYIDSISSYTRAFQEGIADYGGNIGSPDDWRSHGDWETYEAGEDGIKGKIEGHVAATFHDLMDGGTEADDPTNYNGGYVMEVFRTCEAERPRGVYISRRYVSDFVWCLENRVNSSVHDNSFPGNTAPSKVRESATEPTGWSATRIRNTWVKNLGGTDD